jgi:pimeloyl-ACP methyl ester carboxylesterase
MAEKSVQHFQLQDGGLVPYAEIGDPKGKPFIVIPGLSDGLAPMKGSAPVRFLRWFYRGLGHRRIIVSSRRTVLGPEHDIPAMADDVAELMEGLRATPADVLGVSMGGMIAQELAIRHAASVRRLCLGVTAAYVDEPLTEILDRWERLACGGEWAAFRRDTARLTYTGRMPLVHRLALPLLAVMPPPKADLRRYAFQTEAIRGFDARSRLPAITAPTLVLIGVEDAVTRPELAGPLVALIRGARVVEFADAGHGAFEQAKRAFDRAVLEHIDA